MIEPRRTYTMTKKRYTVQFSAFDPPQPVFTIQTDRLSYAEQVYQDAYASVRNDHIQNGPSGEWTLTLHEHTAETKPKVLCADDPTYADFDFVYGVLFEGSTLLSSYDYNDARRDWNAQWQEKEEVAHAA